jgi:ABC-2 type transport system ATP-binding protein
MEIIRTESLLKCHSYDGFTLGHVNLKVGAGEILGVMGPKGAGKTTLLRLLWGFARPTAGTIAVLGIAPHLHQIEVRQRAGYVPEKAGMYEWMAAGAFLNFIAGFYPGWDQMRAQALLKELGIDDHQLLYRLSPGDKLKLRLVAALGHRPLVLFLDEPMLKQEPAVWLEVHSFLKQISRDENVAIVISSDVSDSLDRLAETVLMLKRGSVVHYDQAATLKKQYGLSSLEDVYLESAQKVSTASRHANA